MKLLMLPCAGILLTSLMATTVLAASDAIGLNLCLDRNGNPLLSQPCMLYACRLCTARRRNQSTHTAVPGASNKWKTFSGANPQQFSDTESLISYQTRREGEEERSIVPSAPPLPGVEVIGAANAIYNGWYHRRKASEGPPKGWGYDYMPHLSWGYDNWVKDSAHYYYEKDDGNCCCHIGSTTRGKTWLLTTKQNGEAGYVTIRYKATGTPHPSPLLSLRYGSPPAKGWKTYKFNSEPVPTLRVVS